MNRETTHKASLTPTIAKLQQSLHMAEVNLRKLLTISVRGGDTVSNHDDQVPVARRSLVLVEDNAQGNVTAPEGTEAQPVCRGEAMIGGQRKKVAAFRKKAAVAAPPAAPAAPTPPANGAG